MCEKCFSSAIRGLPAEADGAFSTHHAKRLVLQDEVLVWSSCFLMARRVSATLRMRRTIVRALASPKLLEVWRPL
jgi:hypothetical protein